MTCRGTVVARSLAAMDDKTKTAPRDRQRINVHEDYELRYWSTKFACTEEQLRAAVQKVGPMVKDVEAEMKRH